MGGISVKSRIPENLEFITYDLNTETEIEAIDITSDPQVLALWRLDDELSLTSPFLLYQLKYIKMMGTVKHTTLGSLTIALAIKNSTVLTGADNWVEMGSGGTAYNNTENTYIPQNDFLDVDTYKYLGIIAYTNGNANAFIRNLNFYIEMIKFPSVKISRVL